MLPTPARFELLAVKLRPHRWKFLGTFMGIVALMFAFMGSGFLASEWGWDVRAGHLTMRLLRLGMGLALNAWLLFVLQAWFYPEADSWSVGRIWSVRLPRVLVVIVKWYAVLFLTMGFLISSFIILFSLMP